MSNRERYDEIEGNLVFIDMDETLEDEEAQIQEDMEALERQRIQKRRERMAAMRQKKRQQELFRSWSLLIAAGVIVLALAVWGVISLVAGHDQEDGNKPGGEGQESSQGTREQTEGNEPGGEGQESSRGTGEQTGGDESGGEGQESSREMGEQTEGNRPGEEGQESSQGTGEQTEGNEPGGESQEGRQEAGAQTEGNKPGGEGQESHPEAGEQSEGEAGETAEKGRQHMQLGKGNPLVRNLLGENSMVGNSLAGSTSQEGSSQKDLQNEQEQSVATFAFSPHITEHTAGFPEEGRGVYSTNGILINVETEEIVACREPYQRINPASMTKILTLLVAAEHVENLQDTFTITAEIADYTYRHGCSIAGFGVGEVVTVEELMYGTILPSGAEAAMALAEYVAGSQEAFVGMMNQKLEQLGLSDSAHFTNCVGLYDEDHYCTVYDMALILKAVTDNELCRKVMSARKYMTTVVTKEQPEGILLSNWFLRRIEDKDTHGEVLCAKTGYVDQSGSCAASLAADHEGREYICVTTGSISSWACIYDHVEIYQAFLPAAQE